MAGAFRRLIPYFLEMLAGNPEPPVARAGEFSWGERGRRRLSRGRAASCRDSQRALQPFEKPPLLENAFRCARARQFTASKLLRTGPSAAAAHLSWRCDIVRWRCGIIRTPRNLRASFCPRARAAEPRPSHASQAVLAPLQRAWTECRRETGEHGRAVTSQRDRGKRTTPSVASATRQIPSPG